MKTSYSITRLVAVLVLIGGSRAMASTPPDTACIALATTALSQAEEGEASPRARRREASELLKQARKSIEAGEYDVAERYLKQAEATGASFGLLHLGDTPEKVRGDLEKLRAAAQQPKPPSQRFSPTTILDRFTGNDRADGPAPEDPFGDSMAEAAATTGEAVDLLTDPKGKAATYVMNGRRELTRGNLAAAEHWYRKAQQLNAQFTDGEDSPEKLLADIRRAGGRVEPTTGGTNLAGRAPAVAPPAQGTPLPGVPGGAMPDRLRLDASSQTTGSSAPRAFAGMEVIEEPPIQDPVGRIESPAVVGSGTPGQPGSAARPSGVLYAARLALAVGDVNRARALVQQARQTGARAAHDSPERIEAAIAQYEQIQQQFGRGPATPEFRRQLAVHLVQLGASLLAYGDLNEAERLATEAQQQGVTFSQYEIKPTDLLERITIARAQLASGKPASLAATSSPPLAQSANVLPAAATAPGVEQTSELNAPADSPQADSDPQQTRQRVLNALAQARQALQSGQLETAEQLARQAEGFRLPNSAYQEGDDRPWIVLLEIQRARMSGDVAESTGRNIQAGGIGAADQSAVEAAGFDVPQGNVAGADSATRNPLAPESFDQPALPAPMMVPATGGEQQASEVAGQLQGSPSQLATPTASQMLAEGEAALAAGDRGRATQLLLSAYQQRGQLDTGSLERLSSHLAQLSGSAEPMSAAGEQVQMAQPAAATRATGEEPETLIEDAAEALELAARQLSAELTRRQQQARRLQETDPASALGLLREARQMVEQSSIDPTNKAFLLRRVDRDIAEFEAYINDHQALIQLDQQNSETMEQIEREQQVKIEIQEKLALLVDEYNQLMDEQRFAEAELVAKKAQQISPESQLARQLVKQSRLIRQWNNQMAILDRKEEGVLGALASTEESAIPQDDRVPIVFPDVSTWEDLTDRRRLTQPGERIRRSEAEIEIEQKLRTPVMLQYDEAPLGLVMEDLAKLAGVNLHLDVDGLRQEGVDTNTPVTINLSQEISLKSALNLILEQHHLSFVVKDEVLKVTSEAVRQGDLYTVTYNVADLIVPIPHFSPGNRLGLEGSLANSYGQLGYGGAPFAGGGGPPLTVLASNEGGSANAMIDPNVLAQVGASGGGGGAIGGGMGAMGFGPGGMGGGANADFDSLIELITTTIAPTTWEDVGGSGAIESFPTNLSLVISQTEDVHQEIAELLDQLRRLQDLQVTIEVRFITLNDNFFERIGVDFDFDIDDDIDRPFQIFGQPDPNFQPQFDNSGVNPGRNVQDRDHHPSLLVGQSAPGVFSADLDLPFRQDSFTLAVPQFGGFDATAGAQLGFAILSDLEAFFFINAAQGDRRTNILQAPKVTLFNGQQAFVADVSQSPFVISVIPVVGDFAAAQQPVIVVLNEGTFLTVQAVVSEDRRFVRLTLVPFFSQIGDVDTFTFTGSTTTTSNTSSEGPEEETTSRMDDTTVVTEGTTVQLPTFSFFSVATTVSVPDGGSVLLGGIKRLNEGRSEAGVPFLNKLPYVSRLFKNVGIGRETSSLMMMVTPRIIIQEEEEALLLGGS